MLDMCLKQDNVHFTEDSVYVAPQGRTRVMGERGRELHLKQSGLLKMELTASTRLSLPSLQED